MFLALTHFLLYVILQTDGCNGIYNGKGEQQNFAEKPIKVVGNEGTMHRVSTVTFSPNNYVRNGNEALAPTVTIII